VFEGVWELDVGTCGETIQMVRSPVTFDGVPPLGVAPEFGQHTEEILLELGHSWKEIDSLKATGATT
jgi:formyl-CoA transferase